MQAHFSFCPRKIEQLFLELRESMREQSFNEKGQDVAINKPKYSL
jgi:hypothetical protein